MFKGAIGIALLAALPAVAYGSAMSTTSQLLALERTWLQAGQDRNIPVLRRILSDDYVDINYKGVVRSKADALRGSNVSLKGYTQKLSDEKVRVYGGTAVITGRGVLENGKHAAVAAWRFTDVFVKHGGAWRAVSSQETLER